MKLRIFAQFGLDLLSEYKRNPLCGSTSIQILIKATFSICLCTLVRGVGCCRIMCEVLVLILYRYYITQHYFNLFFVCSGPSWDMKSLRHNVGQEQQLAVDTHNFSLTSFAYIRYFGALPVINLACSPPFLREIVENAYEFEEGGEGNKVNSINYFRLYQRIQHCQQAANFEEPTIEFAWGRISLGQIPGVYTSKQQQMPTGKYGVNVRMMQNNSPGLLA